MDIARIRKKAKEKEAKGKAAEAVPAVRDAADTPQMPVSHVGPAPEVTGELEDAPILHGAVEEKTGEGAAPPGVEAAGQMPSGPKEAEALELLTFSLSSEEFAFRVSEVEEIIRFQRITRVPTMPDYVRGITSLRGKIIPVIDLNTRLALKGTGELQEERGDKREDRRILILSGPKGMIGATIDKVLGVMRFPEGTILDPPAHLTENELKYIEGVVILEKRFISIVRSDDALDIEFASKEGA
jgi:purine-binding chemotaxis protein CheW